MCCRRIGCRREQGYLEIFVSELRKFYIKSMGALALGTALYVVFVMDRVLPFVHHHFPENELAAAAASALTSRITIVAILIAGELLIRKYLWRRFHPELDFSGRWAGETTYAIDWTMSGAPEGVIIAQEVQFEQDCLDLRLPPSVGDNFTFESRTIDIADRGARLVYAYHVRYRTNTRHRPDEAYGYEELAVVELEKGRPKALKGWFSHCMQGQKPVFTGDVQLVRQKGKQK
jgi:hypothetical protein